MKILHLVAGSLYEGAARGALWLHNGLLETGVDSCLLNNTSLLDYPNVDTLANTKRGKLNHKLLPYMGSLPKYLYPNRKNRIFNTGLEGGRFFNRKEFLSCDIVHLHWINGLVSVQSLKRINKPIVWTLRDMWPFTGGCHYSIDCDKYKVGCGACPQLGSSNKYDLSRFVAWNKLKSFPRDLKIVAISNWLAECARNSLIFRDYNINVIFNNVDTSGFDVCDKHMSRNLLGIPAQKKVVLVGAQSVTSFYKGFDLFLESLKYLKTPDIFLCFFGRFDKKSISDLNYPAMSMGFVADILRMKLIYSAADVFVAPSRQEAFGKTLAESLACGTPVACFDATGPADIVDHKITGYKAEPFSSRDLARGIDWSLSRDHLAASQMREECRLSAESKFSIGIIAQQYLNLYNSIL